MEIRLRSRPPKGASAYCTVDAPRLTKFMPYRPLADKVQGENVLKYIDIGKADGKLQVGGERVGDKVSA